jgi:hypothetical protein
MHYAFIRIDENSVRQFHLPAHLQKRKFILKYLINKTKDFHQIQFFVNGAPFAASWWPLMMRAHSIQVYYTPRGLAW